jgi:hypothetical protein
MRVARRQACCVQVDRSPRLAAPSPPAWFHAPPVLVRKLRSGPHDSLRSSCRLASRLCESSIETKANQGQNTDLDLDLKPMGSSETWGEARNALLRDSLAAGRADAIAGPGRPGQCTLSQASQWT